MLQHLGNLTPQHIPPRSRLYNLEPAGIRTAYVESLTGYVARLAEEHTTTLYYLFSEEVAPLINKPGTISHSVSFPSFAKAADGMGVIAADLVETFEKLTSRREFTVYDNAAMGRCALFKKPNKGMAGMVSGLLLGAGSKR